MNKVLLSLFFIIFILRSLTVEGLERGSASDGFDAWLASFSQAAAFDKNQGNGGNLKRTPSTAGNYGENHECENHQGERILKRIKPIEGNTIQRQSRALLYPFNAPKFLPSFPVETDKVTAVLKTPEKKKRVRARRNFFFSSPQTPLGLTLQEFNLLNPESLLCVKAVETLILKDSSNLKKYNIEVLKCLDLIGNLLIEKKAANLLPDKLFRTLFIQMRKHPYDIKNFPRTEETKNNVIQYYLVLKIKASNQAVVPVDPDSMLNLEFFDDSLALKKTDEEQRQKKILNDPHSSSKEMNCFVSHPLQSR